MGSLKFRLRIFFLVFMGTMVIGVLGSMVAEGLSFTDALYFSIVTVATVGYGDIHPATLAGKAIAVILIIGGVGTFLGIVANATEILLNRREAQIRVQKLHMFTGLFFSELGTKLILSFSTFDPGLDRLRKDLIISTAWEENDFSKVSGELRAYGYEVDIRKGNLLHLRTLLEQCGAILLRLMENPTLLEHDSFAGLLRALFHLREELLLREDLSRLPETDYAHLAGDINRAYRLLVLEWLGYVKYLQIHYPFLFSLAIRTNPFNPASSVIVQ